jgi:hypothetical protein
MGDTMKAISDDIKDYLALCEKYGEKAVRTNDRWAFPDAYSKHAEGLRERDRREQEQASADRKKP